MTDTLGTTVLLYLVALLAGWAATRVFFRFFSQRPAVLPWPRTVLTLLLYEAFVLAVLFDAVLGTAAALTYYVGLPPNGPIQHPVNFLLSCFLGSTIVQSWTYLHMRVAKGRT